MAEEIVVGINTVTENIKAFKKQIRLKFDANLKEAAKVLRGDIRQNIKLRDHSLKDLAAMGHPYSKRSPRNIHEPSWLIHRQSGSLNRSLKIGTSSNKNGRVYKIGFDEGIAPHARFVVLGTSKMVPRDVLGETLKQTKQKLFDIIIKDLIPKV